MSGMVEIAARIGAHAESLHHGGRTVIVAHREGDDLGEPERFEAECEPGSVPLR